MTVLSLWITIKKAMRKRDISICVFLFYIYKWYLIVQNLNFKLNSKSITDNNALIKKYMVLKTPTIYIDIFYTLLEKKDFKYYEKYFKSLNIDLKNPIIDEEI